MGFGLQRHGFFMPFPAFSICLRHPRHDLQRLSGSYQHLSCFQQLAGTLDVQEAYMTMRRHKGQSTGRAFAAISVVPRQFCLGDEHVEKMCFTFKLLSYLKSKQ